MKHYLIILFAMLSSNLLAQDTLKFNLDEKKPLEFGQDFYKKCKPCYVEIYCNGKKYKEYDAYTDCFTGNYIEYFTNTTSLIKVKGCYSNLKTKHPCNPVGTWMFYDRKGKLIKEINYTDD